MKIGVYDFCHAGGTVAAVTEQAFPEYEVEFAFGAERPAGLDLSADGLLELVLPGIRSLAKATDVVVIACELPDVTVRKLRRIIPISLVVVVHDGDGGIDEKALLKQLRGVLHGLEADEEKML